MLLLPRVRSERKTDVIYQGSDRQSVCPPGQVNRWKAQTSYSEVFRLSLSCGSLCWRSRIFHSPLQNMAPKNTRDFIHFIPWPHHMVAHQPRAQRRAVDQSTCRWDLIQIPNPKRFGGEPEKTSDSDGAVHGVASCGTHSEELQTSSHFTNLLKHVRSSCQERPCQPERFPRKPTAEAKQMNHKRRCRRRVLQFVQTCYHGVGGWMISINISCRAVVPLQ
ncbi:hypothetical protein INR49_008404, partial [Caranx melampygus]